MGRAVRLQLSPAARRALAARSRPLLAEMELFFSCLIRKQVRFREHRGEVDAVPAAANLMLRFHPVMTAACTTEQRGAQPPLTEFPIARVTAFVPHWLRIDYRDQAWTGEFGFDCDSTR